ncbi:MAG: BspA family leucine-rich repeat surface protein, partial [Erysipelotrichales bacterium]|nr:BspA family leucine-rich repeat surface protein [Erysipelotrichales bacterium]
MKKNKAAIIGLCVALVMCFMPGAVRAYTAEGTSGTVQWTIDEEGTMVFSPVSGTAGTLAATPNEAGDSPFIDYCDQIRKIRFEGTVKAPRCIRNLFKGLDRLEEFDTENFSVANVTNAIDLFNGCRSLRTLDLSGWNTARMVYMTRMFANCASLEQ